MSQQKIKQAYKFVDGVPNLSDFDFDNITKCSTCIKVNPIKNSLNKHSLSEMVTCRYQDHFIYFGFSSCISYKKERKVIPSSCEDNEGINCKTAWILISDAQTKMLYDDTHLSKVSPINYLESFMQEYSPNVLNKFVVLDQGCELYCYP